MKKRIFRPLLLAAIGAAVLLAGILIWSFGTYTWRDGHPCRKDTESLDLSGTPLSQEEMPENFII